MLLHGDDLDLNIGSGLEPRLCLATFSLCHQLREAFPHAENLPKLSMDEAKGQSEEIFMKHLYANGAAYLQALPRYSETQMLVGADALSVLCTTMVHAQKQYTFKGRTTPPLRTTRKVYLAKLITEAGLLPALAAAASHMSSVLQKQLQQQQLQQQQQQHKQRWQRSTQPKAPDRQLSSKEQQLVLEFCSALVQLFATTATWWPGGKLFHSKPFDSTWPAVASLTAALLQTVKSIAAIKAAAAAAAGGGKKQATNQGMSKAVLVAAEQLMLCADVCAGVIIEGFGCGDFAGHQRHLSPSEEVKPAERITPRNLTPAIQEFLLSEGLVQLLELNLAVAGLTRYTRLLGYSTVPAPPGLSSDSFASSSSSSGSNSKRGGDTGQLPQQQQKLRVGPLHAPLLLEFGIETTEDLADVLKAWHKDWEPDAIKSLYLITTYQQQQQQQAAGSSSSTDKWQWKVDRLCPQGYNCWHHLAMTHTHQHNMKLILLVKVMIELIALDPEGQTETVWMLLQLANLTLVKLQVQPDDLKHQRLIDKGSDDGDDDDDDGDDDDDDDFTDQEEEEAVWELTKEQQHRQRRLPLVVAGAMLPPVLQLLGPVVLHLLREKASRDQLDANRGVMFFAAQLLTVLIGQSELFALSVSFYRSPVASASIIEASLRAIAAGQLDPKQQQQQLNQGAAAAAAVAATSKVIEAAGLQGHAFRVALALSMGLNDECGRSKDSQCSKAGAAAESQAEATARKQWYLTGKEAAAALTAAGDAGLQHMTQQHLVSLLNTCLKLGGAAVAAAAAERRVGWAAVGLSQVVNQALTTAQLACQLNDLFLQQQQQQQQKQTSAARAGKGKNISSRSAEQQQQKQLDPVQSGFGPWAVIVSRSLLLLIRVLRQAAVSFRAEGSEDDESPEGATAADDDDDDLDDDSEDPFYIPLYGPTQYDYWEGVPEVKQVLRSSSDAVSHLRQQLKQHITAAAAATGTSSGAGISNQLAVGAAAAAKYLPNEAHERLELLADDAAAAVAGALAAAELDNDPKSRIPGLLDELLPDLTPAMWEVTLSKLEQYAAAVHDQLPLSSCCNNPGCLNVDKLSEQQLVAGKGSLCGGCGVARYCSRDCQKQHWKQHKVVCKSLQSAGAV